MRINNKQILKYLSYGATGFALVWFIAAPTIEYLNLSDEVKCQQRLEKENYPDAYCNENNETGSIKELNESIRRAQLTPKEKCEEDESISAQYNDGGYFAVCDDKGDASYHSIDELEDDYLSEPDFPQDDDRCDSNYSGGCVPVVNYDLNCPDIGFTVKVEGYDTHNFDGDYDGYGCESY